MIRTLNILLLISIFVTFPHTYYSTVLAALPPGYDEDILCHSASACLRPYHRPRGWSDARTAFVECCDPSSGEVSRPRGWGWRLDAGYLEELLRDGWVIARRCSAEEAGRCGRRNEHGFKPNFKALDSSLEMMVGIDNVLDRLLVLTGIEANVC